MKRRGKATYEAKVTLAWGLLEATGSTGAMSRRLFQRATTRQKMAHLFLVKGSKTHKGVFLH